jgi:hypothetical protein
MHVGTRWVAQWEKGLGVPCVHSAAHMAWLFRTSTAEAVIADKLQFCQQLGSCCRPCAEHVLSVCHACAVCGFRAALGYR